MQGVKYDTGSKIYRFQFDIPNSQAGKVPDTYTNTTVAKQSKRYQNETLKELVTNLEEAEENLKNALSPFLRKLFKKFYKKQHLWSSFLACIAEVD